MIEPATTPRSDPPQRRSQYTAIRYANRLLDAGAVASIGSVGDSYDNALAESVIGLYKTECVRHDGPLRGADELELATLSWVHWFNHHRLHSMLGHVTSVEYETEYYRHNQTAGAVPACEPSLHGTRGGSGRVRMHTAAVGAAVLCIRQRPSGE